MDKELPVNKSMVIHDINNDVAPVRKRSPVDQYYHDFLDKKNRYLNVNVASKKKVFSKQVPKVQFDDTISSI